MMQHYAIDLLNEYRTEEIPETKRPVVNPQWRNWIARDDGQVQADSPPSPLRRVDVHPQSDEAAQSKWEKRKAEWCKRSSNSITN